MAEQNRRFPEVVKLMADFEELNRKNKNKNEVAAKRSEVKKELI